MVAIALPALVWSLVSAILGIAAGAVLLWLPLQGTLSLTAVLTAFLYLLVGINMLFGGWALIWMAPHARTQQAGTPTA
jgi:uncharacterized membrane protein HdeD (DUF308 family)